MAALFVKPGKFGGFFKAAQASGRADAGYTARTGCGGKLAGIGQAHLAQQARKQARVKAVPRAGRVDNWTWRSHLCDVDKVSRARTQQGAF